MSGEQTITDLDDNIELNFENSPFLLNENYQATIPFYVDQSSSGKMILNFGYGYNIIANGLSYLQPLIPASTYNKLMSYYNNITNPSRSVTPADATAMNNIVNADMGNNYDWRPIAKRVTDNYLSNYYKELTNFLEKKWN